MTYAISIAIFAILNSSVGGKTFTRCELVWELRMQGFPESRLRVCLVESESARNTHAVGKVNKDGSLDYGLFQINDKYWCSNTDTPGKDCNVPCKDLLNDDIMKAATCAKKIYQRQKFEAWHGWVKRCKGKPLPDISLC